MVCCDSVYIFNKHMDGKFICAKRVRKSINGFQGVTAHWVASRMGAISSSTP
jgi:hypothetical protein